MIPRVSYAELFGLPPAETPLEQILPGDTVRRGANFMPHFLVVATDGAEAWLRNVDTGASAVATLAGCRLVMPLRPPEDARRAPPAAAGETEP